MIFPPSIPTGTASNTLTMQYLMMKLKFSTGIRPWDLVHLEVIDLYAGHLRLRIRNKGNQKQGKTLRRDGKQELGEYVLILRQER